MKSIVDQMCFYEAYHRHPLNKATHFIGIPSIIFSILVPLSWLRVEVAGWPVTAAMVLVAGVMVYYTLLSLPLAAGMLVFILPTLYIAHQAAGLSYLAGTGIFLLFFVGGWIFQLIGHGMFEHRRPALVDNLFQMIIGPLFLVAEVFFALGYRPDLHRQIQESSLRHAPASNRDARFSKTAEESA
ncbi:MAG TPA: DUF962 domain-containing protein [Candidatus Hydrogenedentes bacterium]|nr:DUF962 domain-containing protein [Candidatus Hydrogenedentota bacterium]